MPTVLAADLGGTNLRAALVREDGELLVREQDPTPPEAPTDVLVEHIVSLLAGVTAMAPPGAEPVVACIGTPGLIDAHAGRVIVSPNIPGFRNLDLVTPVQAALRIPAYIENDASAAGLGESHFGAGRGLPHLLHATLGTGIGGGIVINGRLHRGARGLAGEIGHIVMDLGGPPCRCGSRGCLEALVSGTAFAARAERLLASGRSSILREMVGERPPTGVDLHEAARAGDALAEAEIRNGGHILGLGLGGLVNVLNPDAVTLSGGLLSIGDMFLAPAREAFYSIAYGPSSGTQLLLSSLGEDAGLLGAAAVALERHGDLEQG